MALCTLYGQNVIFNDNFDSYTAGQTLASQSTNWTTWSQSPGSSEDGLISTEQALSGSNSLKIQNINDIIYRFSNQTTGHYTVEFDMYVPSTGSGAYFNIQHYYNPGVMWAFECFFYNNGSGYLTTGGQDYNFNMPNNTWFHVSNNINLDADSITLTINNVAVHSWPFSYESGTTSGNNQLGSVNFYAGAPNSATGTYYVDNFQFSEISASNDGDLVIDPSADIDLSLNVDELSTYQINLSNLGGTDVNYRVVPIFDIPTPSEVLEGDIAITYAGVQNTGIIFRNTELVNAAIGFPSTTLLNNNFIGKSLRSIDVYLANVTYIISAKIIVCDMNGILVPGPGNIIYEQAFTPVEGLNYVTLNTPYLIDGRDLWFGVQIQQISGETDLPSIGIDDATTPNEYGNWFKTGVAWNPLSNNADLTGNWYIIGHIDGTEIVPWMSVNPAEGVLSAAANQNITVTLGSDDLEEGDQKSGNLYIYSDVIDDQQTIIPVNIEIILVGVEENSINISIYPNPAFNVLNISCDNLNHVEIYDISGKKILDNSYTDNQISIDVTNWMKGTYLVKTTTNNFITKIQKVIIQ